MRRGIRYNFRHVLLSGFNMFAAGAISEFGSRALHTKLLPVSVILTTNVTIYARLQTNVFRESWPIPPREAYLNIKIRSYTNASTFHKYSYHSSLDVLIRFCQYERLDPE